MISLREAAFNGVDKVRRPEWANPEDYLKLDIVDGEQLGPWVHLFSPVNELIGQPNPTDMLWPGNLDPDEVGYEIWVVPKSEKLQ